MQRAQEVVRAVGKPGDHRTPTHRAVVPSKQCRGQPSGVFRAGLKAGVVEGLAVTGGQLVDRAGCCFSHVVLIHLDP